MRHQVEKDCEENRAWPVKLSRPLAEIRQIRARFSGFLFINFSKATLPYKYVMFVTYLVVPLIIYASTAAADNAKIGSATLTGSDFSIDVRSAALHFVKPRFSILDCENVGEIEKGEVDQHVFELFYSIDRDRSLAISEEEYLSSAANRSPHMDQFIFRLMDADANGKVSTAEFRRHAFAAMDAADVDKDGEVTEAEAGISVMSMTAK